MGVVVNQQNDATARNIAGTTNALSTVISARGSVGTSTFRVNCASVVTLATNPGTKVGHWAVTRRDATNIFGFLNGSLNGSGTQATSSVATDNVTVLRASTVYDSSRVSAFWWGQAMSDAQMLAVHTRLTTYLTAIGPE
jgi:hypothetical protein